jgi:hypothetical protein
MKKIVLVVYFTQSGQLNNAVRATLSPFEKDENVELFYEEIKPVTPFPFPWTFMQFFDKFPECVQGIPCELQPLKVNPNENFDLIIIAYQAWFLSVSIPINSFLQTEAAKTLLKNKKVVTVISCRNMWLNAQEKMKASLLSLKADLVGNITYVDRASNLTSLITVMAFVFKGVQDKYLGFMPVYGVSKEELAKDAPVFGGIVLKHFARNEYSGLQKELIESGAIKIKANLMILEGRGKVFFPIYANFISKKGTSGTKERRARVRSFGIILPIVVFTLSPIITVISRVVPLLFPKKNKREMDYHSNNFLR